MMHGREETIGDYAAGSNSRRVVAELRGAFDDQLRVGVVVLAAQAQKRVDVGLVEIELANRRDRRVASRGRHQGIVDALAIRNLKILAPRERLGRDATLRVEVQQVAECLQLVTLLIDALHAFGHNDGGMCSP